MMIHRSRIAAREVPRKSVVQKVAAEVPRDWDLPLPEPFESCGTQLCGTRRISIGGDS